MFFKNQLSSDKELMMKMTAAVVRPAAGTACTGASTLAPDLHVQPPAKETRDAFRRRRGDFAGFCAACNDKPKRGSRLLRRFRCPEPATARGAMSHTHLCYWYLESNHYARLTGADQAVPSKHIRATRSSIVTAPAG